MRPQSLLSVSALVAGVTARHVFHGDAASRPGDSAQGLLVSPGEDVSVSGSVSDGLEGRGFAGSLWEKLKSGAGCAACETVFAMVKGLATLGDQSLISVLQGICKISKAQEDDVCDDAIALEGPIIARSLRNMKIGSRASKEFYVTLLGACAYPPVTPWTVPFLSPKPQRQRPRADGRKTLKVVHYSDIHVDTSYVAGSSTNCKKPICCRPYTDADKPGKSSSPAGPFGDHKCDVPVGLERSMYEAINRVAPDAAFTIFTGDIVEHAVWNTSKPTNEDSIERAYTAMHNSLSLVYGTAGNHEAHPVDGFQSKSIGSATQWVYDLLSQQWSSWIGDAAAKQAADLGAYSVKYPHGNLRVISLNTNLYYRNNFWLYYNLEQDRDPNRQLEWLVRELDGAERAGENVYIIGHMPLGDKGALHDGSNYLDQIVNRYSSTIAAMFFGHTHVDQFEIHYSDYRARSADTAVGMSYIAPSLTPTAGMPSFRVYEVDAETFGVLDVTTYIADMSDARFQTKGPVWKKLYSAREAYGHAGRLGSGAELTPGFWHRVTEAMERPDGGEEVGGGGGGGDALFDAYLARKSRGWQVTPGSCRGTCKSDEICQLRAGRAQNNCHKPAFGFHLERRQEEEVGMVAAAAAAASRGEHDECERPVVLETFGALTTSEELVRQFKALVDEEMARAGKMGS